MSTANGFHETEQSLPEPIPGSDQGEQMTTKPDWLEDSQAVVRNRRVTQPVRYTGERKGGFINPGEFAAAGEGLQNLSVNPVQDPAGIRPQPPQLVNTPSRQPGRPNRPLKGNAAAAPTQPGRPEVVQTQEKLPPPAEEGKLAQWLEEHPHGADRAILLHLFGDPKRSWHDQHPDDRDAARGVLEQYTPQQLLRVMHGLRENGLHDPARHDLLHEVLAGKGDGPAVPLSDRTVENAWRFPDSGDLSDTAHWQLRNTLAALPSVPGVHDAYYLPAGMDPGKVFGSQVKAEKLTSRDVDDARTARPETWFQRELPSRADLDGEDASWRQLSANSINFKGRNAGLMWQVRLPDHRVYLVQKHPHPIESHVAAATSAALRFLGLKNVPKAEVRNMPHGNVLVQAFVPGKQLYELSDQELDRAKKVNRPEDIASLMAAEWALNITDRHGRNYMVSHTGHVYPIDLGISLHPDLNPMIAAHVDNAMLASGLVDRNQEVPPAFLQKMAQLRHGVTELIQTKLSALSPQLQQKAVQAVQKRLAWITQQVIERKPVTLRDLQRAPTPGLTVAAEQHVKDGVLERYAEPRISLAQMGTAGSRSPSLLIPKPMIEPIDRHASFGDALGHLRDSLLATANPGSFLKAHDALNDAGFHGRPEHTEKLLGILRDHPFVREWLESRHADGDTPPDNFHIHGLASLIPRAIESSGTAERFLGEHGNFQTVKDLYEQLGRTRRSIVLAPRGSWKWQNAHKVVEYEPHRTTDGRWVWKSSRDITGKSSMPQLRRSQHWELPEGGLHHRPLTEEEQVLAGVYGTGRVPTAGQPVQMGKDSQPQRYAEPTATSLHPVHAKLLETAKPKPASKLVLSPIAQDRAPNHAVGKAVGALLDAGAKSPWFGLYKPKFMTANDDHEYSDSFHLYGPHSRQSVVELRAHQHPDGVWGWHYHQDVSPLMSREERKKAGWGHVSEMEEYESGQPLNMSELARHGLQPVDLHWLAKETDKHPYLGRVLQNPQIGADLGHLHDLLRDHQYWLRTGEPLTRHGIVAAEIADSGRLLDPRSKIPARQYAAQPQRLHYAAEQHPMHAAVRDAAQEIHPAPSPAQREAGNHRMGHIRWNGLDITLETAKGQTREKHAPDGTRLWSRKMHAHYGRIRGTEAADREHCDIYLGEHPQSDLVVVIEQLKQDGSHDEYKSILGCTNKDDAVALYLRHYPEGWEKKRVGKVQLMTVPEFKQWVFSPKSKKPARQGREGSPERYVAIEGPVIGVRHYGHFTTDSAGEQTVDHPVTREQLIQHAARGAVHAMVMGRTSQHSLSGRPLVPSDGIVNAGSTHSVMIAADPSGRAIASRIHVPNEFYRKAGTPLRHSSLPTLGEHPLVGVEHHGEFVRQTFPVHVQHPVTPDELRHHAGVLAARSLISGVPDVMPIHHMPVGEVPADHHSGELVAMVANPHGHVAANRAQYLTHPHEGRLHRLMQLTSDYMSRNGFLPLLLRHHPELRNHTWHDDYEREWPNDFTQYYENAGRFVSDANERGLLHAHVHFHPDPHWRSLLHAVFSGDATAKQGLIDALLEHGKDVQAEAIRNVPAGPEIAGHLAEVMPPRQEEPPDIRPENRVDDQIGPTMHRRDGVPDRHVLTQPHLNALHSLLAAHDTLEPGHIQAAHDAIEESGHPQTAQLQRHLGEAGGLASSLLNHNRSMAPEPVLQSAARQRLRTVLRDALWHAETESGEPGHAHLTRGATQLHANVLRHMESGNRAEAADNIRLLAEHLGRHNLNVNAVREMPRQTEALRTLADAVEAGDVDNWTINQYGPYSYHPWGIGHNAFRLVPGIVGAGQEHLDAAREFLKRHQNRFQAVGQPDRHTAPTVPGAFNPIGSLHGDVAGRHIEHTPAFTDPVIHRIGGTGQISHPEPHPMPGVMTATPQQIQAKAHEAALHAMLSGGHQWRGLNAGWMKQQRPSDNGDTQKFTFLAHPDGRVMSFESHGYHHSSPSVSVRLLGLPDDPAQAWQQAEQMGLQPTLHAQLYDAPEIRGMLQNIYHAGHRNRDNAPFQMLQDWLEERGHPAARYVAEAGWSDDLLRQLAEHAAEHESQQPQQHQRTGVPERYALPHEPLIRDVHDRQAAMPERPPHLDGNIYDSKMPHNYLHRQAILAGTQAILNKNDQEGWAPAIGYATKFKQRPHPLGHEPVFEHAAIHALPNGEVHIRPVYGPHRMSFGQIYGSQFPLETQHPETGEWYVPVPGNPEPTLQVGIHDDPRLLAFLKTIHRAGEKSRNPGPYQMFTDWLQDENHPSGEAMRHAETPEDVFHILSTPWIWGPLSKVTSPYPYEARRILRETDPSRLEQEHYTRPDSPERYDTPFTESDHPRGQPGNAGQFAPAGGTAPAPAQPPRPPSQGRGSRTVSEQSRHEHVERAKAILSDLGRRGVHAALAGLDKTINAEHIATEWVSDRVQERVDRLPPTVRDTVRGVWVALRMGTAALFATYTAGQRVAEEVARAKGATPEELTRLKGVLQAVDVFAAKPAIAVGHMASGGTLGMALGMIPVASTAYLAYSLATDPVATMNGARDAVQKALLDRVATFQAEGEPQRFSEPMLHVPLITAKHHGHFLGDTVSQATREMGVPEHPFTAEALRRHSVNAAASALARGPHAIVGHSAPQLYEVGRTPSRLAGTSHGGVFAADPYGRVVAWRNWQTSHDWHDGIHRRILTDGPSPRDICGFSRTNDWDDPNNLYRPAEARTAVLHAIGRATETEPHRLHAEVSFNPHNVEGFSALLRASLQGDDAAKGMLSDWLEERGHPAAEAVRNSPASEIAGHIAEADRQRFEGSEGSPDRHNRPAMGESGAVESAGMPVSESRMSETPERFTEAWPHPTLLHTERQGQFAHGRPTSFYPEYARTDGEHHAIAGALGRAIKGMGPVGIGFHHHVGHLSPMVETRLLPGDERPRRYVMAERRIFLADPTGQVTAGHYWQPLGVAVGPTPRSGPRVPNYSAHQLPRDGVRQYLDGQVPGLGSYFADWPNNAAGTDGKEWGEMTPQERGLLESHLQRMADAHQDAVAGGNLYATVHAHPETKAFLDAEASGDKSALPQMLDRLAEAGHPNAERWLEMLRDPNSPGGGPLLHANVLGHLMTTPFDASHLRR